MIYAYEIGMTLPEAIPVCTENLIRVDDVMESPLMSVVNGSGNRLFSPGGTPTKCAQGRR